VIGGTEHHTGVTSAHAIPGNTFSRHDGVDVEKQDKDTVKAFNFEPHENFGHLFSEGLPIIKTRPTEK
jgi:hypothetical protein